MTDPREAVQQASATILELAVDGGTYRLRLPHAESDYIQKKLVAESKPYELGMLEDMRARLEPGDLVVDVGANVGNHTLYLAAVAGCKVEAFEPNAELCRAVLDSVSLNGLEGRVRVHAVGVGREPARARFGEALPDNLGAQRLAVGDGDVEIVALDGFTFDQPVRLIKIDVEGMEMDVLDGARALVERDRPMIYVECIGDRELDAVSRWCEKRGYSYWETFNATPTHLFVPAEGLNTELRLSHLQLKVYREEARTAQLTAAVRQKLTRAYDNEREAKRLNAELTRDLERRTAEQQRAEQALKQASARTEATLALRERLQGEQAVLRGRLEEATAERDRLRNELVDVKAESVRLRDGMAALEGNRASDASRLARLEKELSGLQENRRTMQRELEVKTGQLQAVQRRLDRLLASTTYRIASALVACRRSVPSALRLPATLWRIYQSAKRRKQGGRPAPNGNGSASAGGVTGTKKADPGRGVAALPRPTRRVPVLRETTSVSKLRVACVFDEFTFHAFAPECELLQLKPGTWTSQVEKFKPDFVFIESAWQGADGEWHKKVSDISGELLGLLEWAADQGVPTAFWCKEDPVHFARFLPVARLVDHVFTTDIDCIPKYKDALRHDRVYLLPFAAQPAIHNPIETVERTDAFCFAGSYYPHYPDRQVDFHTLVTVARELKSVDIYDRNANRPQPHEFAFPQEYRDEIRGSLPYTEMDRAYKGYRYGITVNTIKQSQTMFARRAYELMACNTIVVSNFSKGLRLFFGDLVIASDDLAELRHRLAPLCGDEALYRQQRLRGLRRVMSQHTYEHRLAYVATQLAGAPVKAAEPRVCMVGEPAGEQETRWLVESFARQSLPGAQLALVAAPVPLPEGLQGVRFCADRSELKALLEDCDYVACASATDYHGSDYLADLAMATRFARGEGVTKAARYVAGDGGVRLEGGGQQYRQVGRADLRCSLLRAAAVRRLLDDPACRLDQASIEGPALTSIDEFSYCRDARLSAAFDPASVDLPPTTGPGADFIGTILRTAEAIDVPGGDADPNAPLSFTAAEWLKLFPKGIDPRLEVSTNAAGQAVLASTLGAGEHQYIYFTRRFTVEELHADRERFFQLEADARLDLRTVFVFHDSADRKLSHAMHTVGARYALQAPPETASIRLALRIQGPGRATLGRLMLAESRGLPLQVLPAARHLIVTNQYPSYSDLYRYGFVHARARAYVKAGTPVEVLRLSQDPKTVFREFGDIDVVEADHRHLEQCLAAERYDSLLIHIIDQRMWSVIREHIDRVRVVIWAHGAEIQPWWRRSMNFGTDALRDQARRTSDARMEMWREILCLRHPNLRIVFISAKQAAEALSDLQLDVRSTGGIRIIHNFIDSDLFRYAPKDAAQRHRILSIRPFASHVYANDLSVEAIRLLAERPCFKDLSFRLVGDGTLFEQTVAPIRGLPNVELVQDFLTQRQIAELHREYGVFLVPSRMDSQGVSRDEAMSSGLVPVTTRIAAIPEFVDERCAFLAPPEDAKALADAIEQLHADPALFQSMSAAAAGRVRAQSNHARTIGQELALIHGVAPAHGEDGALARLARSADERTRIALYGDLNLNVMDGSAIWAASLAEVLAGHGSVTVSLLLKARIHRTQVISRLLDMTPDVQLLEPRIPEKAALKPAEAVAELARLDAQYGFRAFVLRGLDLCSEAAAHGTLRQRIWAYLTDIPQRVDEMDAESYDRIAAVIAHSEFILCQTRQMEQYLLELFPQAEGRTRILPPMIPPMPSGRPSGEAAPFRLCYAGKFAPRWGILEMFEAFDRLRERHRDAELHVYGDKIHNPPERPEFRDLVSEKLNGTPGLVWHGAVARDELLRQLRDMHACWAYRDPRFERETLELSTKALEFAALGIPVILAPSPVNESVFGADYPLFARSEEEAQRLLARLAAEPSFRGAVRQRLADVAGHYTFAAVREALARQGMLATRDRDDAAAAPSASDRDALVHEAEA